MKGQKKKLKTIPKLLAETQEVFNAYIRNRDAGNSCISCGSYKANQAGHYFPVKGFSALRFLETNCNLQCSWCNCYQHGAQAMYRIGLVSKYGEETVKELENIAVNNRIKKWSREELYAIQRRYKIDDY